MGADTLNTKNLISGAEPLIKFLVLRTSFVPFVPFVALVGAIMVALGLLIGVLFGRPLIFLVICNDFHRFLGRALILVFALRKCTDGHHAEHRYQQYFSK